MLSDQVSLRVQHEYVHDVRASLHSVAHGSTAEGMPAWFIGNKPVSGFQHCSRQLLHVGLTLGNVIFGKYRHNSQCHILISSSLHAGT